MKLGGMDLPIVAVTSSSLAASSAAAAADVAPHILLEQKFKSDIAASEMSTLSSFVLIANSNDTLAHTEMNGYNADLKFYHLVSSALAIELFDRTGSTEKSKDICQRLANWKRLIETGTEDSKKEYKARLSTLLNFIKESVIRNFDEEKNM